MKIIAKILFMIQKKTGVKIYMKLRYLKSLFNKNGYFPANPVGSYYSPYPDIKDIKKYDFTCLPTELPSIEGRVIK